MRFWDSSALLPLVVEEERSVACRSLHRADRVTVVWVLTRTELTSAVRRLGRETKLVKAEVPLVLRRIERLAKSWTEVDAVGLVRDRAERLLGAHTLTAADALQLGAALVLVRDRPKGKVFVCADDRLILAAEAEGFDVVVPSG
ncbi:MAG TPA: type II toxin-antitoxin system VapC family toxin [Polyangiaceae bacterium]